MITGRDALISSLRTYARKIINIMLYFVPGQEFKALIPHCRLKRKGPPNQYFVNQIEAPVENNAHDNSDDEAQPVDEEAAGDEAYEVGENTPVINAADGPSTLGEWQWSEFLNEIPIDARGTIGKNNPSLKHINIFNLKNWSPVHFFD